MEYIIRDREAGNIITSFDTLAEAEKELAEYERQDKVDGTFSENFYEIVISESMTGYYDFENLLATAIEKGTQESYQSLAAWCNRYDIDSWNGESYDITSEKYGNHSLRPIYDENDDIIAWEITN